MNARTITLRIAAVLLVFALGTAAAPTAEAIIMHLKLDETSGTTAADSSGNGLNGSIVNGTAATVWTSGVVGNALHFGAPTDYLQVLDNALFNFGAGDFSVAFWVNKQESSSGFSNNWGVNQWNTGSAQSQWSLHLNSGGGSNLPQFAIKDTDNVSHSATGSTVLATNNWFHLAGVRDGDEIKLYVNGALEGTTQLSAGMIMNDVANQHLRVANSHQNQNYANAIFDDIGIWGRALSGAEVNGLVNLANNPSLNYDLGFAQQLFSLHAAGSGSVEIDGRTWFVITGLDLGEGGLLADNGDFFLQLDAFGGGVTTLVPPIIPEPTSGLLLASLAVTMLSASRRRRGRRS